MLLDWLTGAIFTLGAAALLHLFLIFPAPGPIYFRVRRGIWLVYLLALAPLPLGTVTQYSGPPVVLSGRDDERAVGYRVTGAHGIARQILELTGVWAHLSGDPDRSAPTAP